MMLKSGITKLNSYLTQSFRTKLKRAKRINNFTWRLTGNGKEKLSRAPLYCWESIPVEERRKSCRLRSCLHGGD